MRNPFSCAATGDYASSPQASGGRFRNATPKPTGAGVQRPHHVGFPLQQAGQHHAARAGARAPADARGAAAPDRSLYRLGHSTVLLRLRGGWWLTDPVFSERASPVQFLGPKRFHAPPISLAELPPLRGVILSHDHYDHLDHRAIKALASKTEVFLSPLGVGDRLAAWVCRRTGSASSIGGKTSKSTACA